MGAASSSNAATAIANVSSYINNSTTANSNAVNNIQQSINLNNCMIKLAGDFNANESATLAQKNSQIISAKQDANINNNIQQAMLQEAQSSVGALGIGFASANNSATTLVNATSQVVNAMNVGCNQYSATDQKFNCNNSTIVAKNLNIGFNNASEFLSSQTLNNDQVSSVVNDVSQSITQKASATVEGISSLLLMIIIAIGIIVYFLMKPLSSGGAKFASAVLMIFIFIIIISIMFLRNTPPFFNNLNQCIKNSAIGLGGTNSCVDFNKEKINLKNPPIKYIYGISPNSMSESGGNLVQMAISSKSGYSLQNKMGPNGGYTAETYLTLSDILSKSYYNKLAQQLNIPNIPNPLYLPQNSNGNYYLIPQEYGGIGSQLSSSANICTPGSVQVGDTSTTTDLKNCPRVLNPNNLTVVTDLSANKNNIIANLNNEDWENYLNMTGKYGPTGIQDEQNIRLLFARFVLCDIIGNIDLNVYINPNEYVKYQDDNNNIIVKLAKDADTNYVYYYTPYNSSNSYDNGFTGPGYITGMCGYVNDSSYRFQKFMRNVGGYILLSLVGLILIYLFYSWCKNRKVQNEKK
jgi:hypothetical protein